MRKLEHLTRTIPVQIRKLKSEAEEETARYELSFSSEEPVRGEILSHAPGAINLTRLKDFGTVLFNHNPDRPIGHVESVDVVDGRGVATITFDDDPFSQEIARKVERGSLRGVSVGYNIDPESVEFLENGRMSRCGRFEGPAYVVHRWEVYEFSIVSIPADASVGVGRSMDGAQRYAYAQRCAQYNKNRSEDR